jgi:hypothetical protein
MQNASVEACEIGSAIDPQGDGLQNNFYISCYTRHQKCVTISEGCFQP